MSNHNPHTGDEAMREDAAGKWRSRNILSNGSCSMNKGLVWHDIGTAPKTGEEFIARTLGKRLAFSCSWDGEAFVHYDRDDGVIRYDPHEWLPMPGDPPEWAEREIIRVDCEISCLMDDMEASPVDHVTVIHRHQLELVQQLIEWAYAADEEISRISTILTQLGWQTDTISKDGMLSSAIDEMRRRMEQEKYVWETEEEFSLNPDWLPVDDTQIGVEFAFEYLFSTRRPTDPLRAVGPLHGSVELLAIARE